MARIVASGSTESRDLLEAIEQIYDAALQPDLWQAVSKIIAKLLSADSAILFTPGVNVDGRVICAPHNIDPEQQKLYYDYYYQHDVFLIEATEQKLLSTGNAGPGHALVSQGTLHRTEFYHDYWRRFGLEHMVASVVFDGVSHPNTVATHLSAFRGSARQPFDEKDVILIRALLPHIQRALALQWRFDNTQVQFGGYEQLFDKLGYGVILLGQNTKIVYANRRAEDVLRTTGVDVRAQRLCGENASCDSRLAQAIKMAAGGVGSDVALRSKGRVVHISVAPVGSELNRASLPNQPTVMLLIKPSRAAKADEKRLPAFAVAHQLTVAEIRVLDLLLRDNAPKAIAVHLDVGIRTVRTHLSSLFHKTNTRTQRELVAYALRAVTTR